MSNLHPFAAKPLSVEDPDDLMSTLARLRTLNRQLTETMRTTPFGRPWKWDLPIEEKRAALEEIEKLAPRGERDQIIIILERYFAHDRRGRALPKTAAEDWVRKLERYPLAAIFLAYDEAIEEIRPSYEVGPFLSRVRGHAGTIAWTISKLEQDIADDEKQARRAG